MDNYLIIELKRELNSPLIYLFRLVPLFYIYSTNSHTFVCHFSSSVLLLHSFRKFKCNS